MAYLPKEKIVIEADLYDPPAAGAPLPATAETAALFFNGKDLTGWEGDMSLWKVEHGEIVGLS